MSRLEELLRALILVAGTFLFTEWIHYRVGAPPIFQYLLGPSAARELASRHDLDSVTEAEFQTYLRVLEAMQANRSLSIDDAAGAENLAINKFREIEQRVQRNEVLIDRARHELRERAESLWNTRSATRDHG